MAALSHFACVSLEGLFGFPESQKPLAPWFHFAEKETKSPLCFYKDLIFFMSSPSNVCSKELLVNIN